MKKVHVPLGPSGLHLELPEATDVYAMSAPETLTVPARAVRESLISPLNSKPLSDIAREKASAAKGAKRSPKACILVSDNTRPVPYIGESGILLPVVDTLIAEGYSTKDILVLVATGTHRAMRQEELHAMIDPKIFALGIEVSNHDCKDEANLVHLGTSSKGSEIHINKRYIDADLKILTGLVESHFMAGASGGRKSVCPGIIGERSTFVFHGAPLMAHPEARDLNLKGNPVHEESLEVAKKAGADFIVNVTLNHSFQLTGVFAGNLETAHEAAVEKVKSYVGVPIKGEYDIVVTHAGFVGINHYQVAKVGVASLGALKKDGHLIVVADNKDTNAIGSMQYRMTLQLLKLIGPEAFTKVIMSKDWTFIPEQWQTQMWTKVFNRIPFSHFHYFAPQLDDRHWADLPGVDGRKYLSADKKAAPKLSDAQAFVDGALAAAIASYPEAQRGKLRIAYLSDGPYGIPYQS
ncbi:MAG: nickel-dependent lactate racemase [Treponemataceae bacterium]